MRWASITAVLAAAAIGVLAWGSPAPSWTQSSAILIPVIWASASNRWLAGCVVMSYTTAASRGLIIGIAQFFDTHLAYGVALWLAAGLFTGFAGWACWHKSAAIRVFLVPVLLIVLGVPPIGLVGWAHPLTAAGWLFPGMGWFGLFAVIIVSMLLAWRSPLLNALVAFLPILAWSAYLSTPAQIPEGWQGHNTHFHFGVGSTENRDLIEEIRRHWAMQSQVAESVGPVHVLPETVGGKWNTQASTDWQRLLADIPGHIVLMGAYEPADDGNYHNVLVEITSTGSRVVYRQRMPIPVGMWRPWSNSSAVPEWLNQSGAVAVAGQQVAVLVCYEALLIWPVLHSVLEKPALLISIASVWWAPESIHRSQHNAMQSWARLFDISLVEAYNL